MVTIIKIRENKDLCVRPTQRGRPVIILQVFAPTQRFLSGGLRFVSETVIKIITVIIKFIFLIIIVRIKIMKIHLSAILSSKGLHAESARAVTGTQCPHSACF